MQLIFATHNKNKIKEISGLINDKYRIISLEDINFFDEISETASTIEENASLKSKFIYNKYKLCCFADDTGLEIDALGGKPGVYSARYAGEQKNSNDNIHKVLTEMEGVPNREARFKTIISLIIEGKEKQFEGIITGKISEKVKGDKGFGYDPIFIPDGYDITFAEMPFELKNKISHRAIAVNKLVDYLNQIA